MIKAGRLSQPGNGLIRLDLFGRQRRHFLRMAGGCVVAGLCGPLFLPSVTRWPSPPDDLWFVACWFGLMAAIAGYYLRIAYGWVEFQEAVRYLRSRA